jgi:hypothetical protein
MKGRTYTASTVPLGVLYATQLCKVASQPPTDPNTGGSPVLGISGSPVPINIFVAGPGKPLINPHVSLIFWGGWWAGNPLANQVVTSVEALLAGPYMSYLAQYGVHRGDVHGTTYVVDREPGLAFTDADVGTLVTDLLGDDQLPEPDDNWPNIYAVILPANSAYAGLAPYDKVVPVPAGKVSTIWGINSRVTWSDTDLPFDSDNDPAYYLWVGNDGTLDYIVSAFSHELVEIATDPSGGDGVVKVGPLPLDPPGNQIGDVGTAWCDYVPGGRAQSYWSIADNALVLPTMYSVRRTLAGKSIGGKIPHTPSAKAWIAGQF